MLDRKNPDQRPRPEQERELLRRLEEMVTRRSEAQVAALREALEKAEGLLHRANDAVESDPVEPRRACFEAIQDYFDPPELGGCGMALADTAASAAAHDAAIIERCAKVAEEADPCFDSCRSIIAAAIRSLSPSKP